MEIEEAREANQRLVESLYAALAAGDGAAVAGLLAEDVDWWFHGPRRCEHMRRRLTGEAPGGAGAFVFKPRRVAAVGRDGQWVVAEGWEGPRAYWVHAWAVDGGRITRFHECFNTSVIVRDVGGGGGQFLCGGAAVCWQGSGGDVERSLPGVVLAI